ncbi:hypothetical protein ALC53_10805, partial [Atta colombica]
GVEFLHKLPHKLHTVQQEADNDEAGVIPELLHHQIAPILLSSAAVIGATAYCRVKRVGLVQVARLADVEGPPEVTLPLLMPVLRQVTQPVEQLLALFEQVTEFENDFALMVVHASHHDHLFGESRPRPDAGWTPFSTTRSRRARVMAPGDSATLLHGAYDDGDHGDQSILAHPASGGAACAPPLPLPTPS